MTAAPAVATNGAQGQGHCLPPFSARPWVTRRGDRPEGPWAWHVIDRSLAVLHSPPCVVRRRVSVVGGKPEGRRAYSWARRQAAAVSRQASSARPSARIGGGPQEGRPGRASDGRAASPVRLQPCAGAPSARVVGDTQAALRASFASPGSKADWSSSGSKREAAAGVSAYSWARPSQVDVLSDVRPAGLPVSENTCPARCNDTPDGCGCQRSPNMGSYSANRADDEREAADSHRLLPSRIRLLERS
jgi:hypothetical protein